MPAEGRRCDCCLSWQSLDGERGECRASAPLPPRSISNGPLTPTSWPLTLADQWCGQFRPLPVVQTLRRPTVVLLCGSTRFRREYEEAFRREEHAGRICLTVPCYKDDPCCKTAQEQAALDALHLAKMALADEVLVINPRVPVCGACGKHVPGEPGGPWLDSDCCHAAVVERPYVGSSTRNEIAHARRLGKRLRWLNPQPEGGAA